jgi:hypothetical protein
MKIHNITLFQTTETKKTTKTTKTNKTAKDKKAKAMQVDENCYFRA